MTQATLVNHLFCGPRPEVNVKLGGCQYLIITAIALATLVSACYGIMYGINHYMPSYYLNMCMKLTVPIGASIAVLNLGAFAVWSVHTCCFKKYTFRENEESGNTYVIKN